MSETCYYHPELKAKATCPACTMAICDQCRLEGDLRRCGNCAAFDASEGAAVEATVPVAMSHDDYTQPMCTNHATLAADMQCLNCMRPFCLSCASTGYCPDCAPDFVNREGAAQRTAAAHVPSAGYEHEVESALNDPGAYGFDAYQEAPVQPEGDFNLAGSYMTDTGTAPAPRPRPPRKKSDGPPKKGAPVAKGGKKPAAKKGAGAPKGLVAGAVAGLVVLGGAGYWFMSAKGPVEEAPTGPMKATITSPKGATIGGQQTIKVKVTSPDDFDYVELLMDGKPWGAKLKKLPIETDWPTVLYPNGKHKLIAKAYYKGGKVVTDTHEFTIQNKN